MKKLLCILLALLLLTACASGAGEAEQKKTGGTFMAGYAKVNITPEDPMPLGGYGNSEKRISTGFTDYIYVTCLAVQDAEGSTAVLMGVDMGGTGGMMISIRQGLAKELDLAEDRVFISASHMHSFPDLSIKNTEVERYIPVLRQAVIDCAKQAIADLAPATLQINTVQTEGLNFVRRYELEGGIFVGYESDVTESGKAIVGHETEVDSSLQLVKFLREEKNDILLANFQTHPHRGAGSSSTLITADLVGVFRNELETKLGYDVIYITGASGNVNPYSLIPEENITKDFREQGKALAKYAIDAEGSYTDVKTGAVRSTKLTFDGEVDHSTDHLVSVAQDALNYYKETGSVAAMREKYLDQGIHSQNHANMIINRAAKANWPFDIWAFAIGDVAFTVSPYEMMDTHGMYIKENSPFAMTVVATCANGGNGYIPSRLICEHGGYEADNTYYVPGSGEILAEMYVQMLDDIK